MGYIILAKDGSTLPIIPANGKYFTLLELRGFVGGDLELVGTTERGGEMYANEDGALIGLPFNYIASGLAGRKLVGDVVVVPPSEWK